jgi:probable phosphoglycerate mutase
VSRLLLWRHGLTTWNAEGRIQGQLDSPLAEEGVVQAEKAAALLASTRPVSIVSSDLSRARCTADALAARTGLPVALDPRLRERHWGQWQGRTHDQLAVEDPERYVAWNGGALVDVPGAEDYEAVGARVAATLRELVSTSDGGPVVVVSHGGALKHGLIAFLGLPGEAAQVVRGLGNCRWADVRARGTGWSLHSYNVGV